MPKRDDAYMAKQRLKIQEVALSCFKQKGFRATTMKFIGEEASLSIGALYTHFKTKHEIIDAIISAMDDHRDTVNIKSVDFFNEMLHQACEDFTDTQNPNLKLNVNLIGAALEDDKLKAIASRSSQHTLNHWIKGLKGLKIKGQLAKEYDIEMGVKLIHALLTGTMINIQFTSSMTKEHLAHLLDAEIRKMRPKAESITD